MNKIDEIDIYGPEGYDLVEEYCDVRINNTNPYEEHCNGDTIIFSKWSVGDKIMYSITKMIDGIYIVGKQELKKNINDWANEIAKEVFEAAVENAGENGVIIINGETHEAE